jgi:glycosidase
MHFVPYRSRSALHKQPFGAAAAGETVTLRVILPRSLCCRGLRLCFGDYDSAWEREYPFAWEGMQGEHEEWWRLCFAPEEPGLCAYRFAYESDFGPGVIGHEERGVGCLGERGRWQLTVYDPAMRLPSWAHGACLYQIFPDRFCASGQAKQNVPEDRLLREDWGGEPRWEPDARGRITHYDFFGGDLRGIAQKLDFLAGLGVSCLYLNPVFEAHSNHRYDTADYDKIDPLLGTEKDFSLLCGEAHKRNMRVLLDGVFSHTGADSVYFNRAHRYTGPGAYESRESTYYNWYDFDAWPEDYGCWWGIPILPELREDEPTVLEFFAGEQGVARRWLRAGADGWRLDVADELPDVFLDRLSRAVREEKPEAFLLGEVWEDASHKWSHGGRRRFLLGAQLHSVMNYPLAEAILRFVLERDAEQLAETVLGQLERYPPFAVHGLMNHIGTHDTPRALNRLCGRPSAAAAGSSRANPPLLPEERACGLRRLRLASALQFTLPGNPCVYYGDEAGLEGGVDPFNRGCYPWGREDAELLAWYRALGQLRKTHGVFAGGGFQMISTGPGCLAFARTPPEENADAPHVLTIANANPHEINYVPPPEWRGAKLLLGGLACGAGGVRLAAESAGILELG